MFQLGEFSMQDQLGMQATWDIKRTGMVERLTEVEGYEATPYVPNKDGVVLGHSGFAFGNGVDAGQWTAEGFRATGIPDYLVQRVSDLGVFGLQGQQALLRTEAINKAYQGMPFSDGEIALMSNAVTGYIENEVRQWLKPGQYDSWTSNEQTAVMSLAHLYGVPTLKTHTKASTAIQNENWSGLFAEMNNYGDAPSQNRHTQMSEYLRPSIIRETASFEASPRAKPVDGLYKDMELAGVALDTPLSTGGLI